MEASKPTLGTIGVMSCVTVKCREIAAFVDSLRARYGDLSIEVFDVGSELAHVRVRPTGKQFAYTLHVKEETNLMKAEIEEFIAFAARATE